MNQQPEIDLTAVAAALRAVKSLRSSMTDLFKCLVDGPSSQESSDSEAAEKQLLIDVQQSINTVNARIRELESSCTLISHSAASFNLNLGNTAHLGQDPAYERSNLFSSLISSYRWNDKMHEFVSNAHLLLSQNQLRRSIAVQNFPNIRQRIPGGIYPRRPTYAGHNLPGAHVDQFLQQLQRLSNDLHIEILRPFGAPTVLKITLERVLKAVILLRGLIIEWVVVKSLNENFETDDGKLDIWNESRYEVFKKISDHANAAMLHFASPIHVDLAIRSFITWLHSYVSLFSKPCRKCECRLQNSMPPTWRDFRSLESYHDSCRP